jgi:hypothetical protein
MKKITKRIPFFFGLLCTALIAGTLGCEQALNLIEKDPFVYRLDLTREGEPLEGEPLPELTRSVFLTGNAGNADSLEITVTNTGTEALEGLTIKARNAGNFNISGLSVTTLAPEESAVFTIAFPASAEKGVHKAELLIGNDDANRILTLNYTAYELVHDDDMSYSPALFQMGETGPFTVATTAVSAGNLISSDPAVIEIAQDGALTLHKAGKATIYFYTNDSETSYQVKGRAVEVHAAKETLNPIYPLTAFEGAGEALGARPGELIGPSNIDAIETAAGEEGGYAFILTGGDPVVTDIDENTGALSFAGEVDDTAEVTVALAITRTVSGEILTTHAGSATFTVKIIPAAPGPAIQSAAIDGAERADAKKLKITYDKAPVLDGIAGFSIKNSLYALNIAEYSVTGTVLAFTLAREPVWAEIAADNLKLAYDGAAGNVRDATGNRGLDGEVSIDLTGFTPEAYQPPSVVDTNGIVLDGNAQTSLVITWNKALDPASGYVGFTVNGAPGLDFIARTVSDAVLTLTMKRAPAPAELDSLSLSYDPQNSSPVKDAAGNAAEAFSNKAVTVVNGNLFVNPPAVTGAEIDAAAPTSLVLSFDEPVAVTSAAGFSLSGSETAKTISTAVSGSGTSSLTFTLNRKPAWGEPLTLSYSAATGNVTHHVNPAVALAGFTAQAVSLSGFTQANDSRPTKQNIVVDADKDGTGASAEQAKKIYLTYDKAVTAVNANGFSVSGSATADTITGIAGMGTATLVLTLNDWPSESEAVTFKLAYDMDLGNVCDNANNANLALSFAATAVEFRNYNSIGEHPDDRPPRLVKATVEDSSKSTLRVEFNEAVTLDTAKFAVKVNDQPFVSLAGATPVSKSMLDLQNRTDRTISGAVAVSGSDGRIWDLTMSAPAAHGEILRLSTAAIPTKAQAAAQAGAATDLAGNLLPGIPEFIVTNKVKRVRGAFESQAGLYVNGVQITTVTDGNGGEMYQNAIAHLHTTGNIPKANDLIILVLDSNQTISTLPSWWGYTGNLAITSGVLTGGGCDIIITTPTGNTQDITITNGTTNAAFQGRNGTRLIIDEHIIFQQAPNTPSQNGLIQMMDGGSIIMDGGAIQNNVNEKSGSGAQAADLMGGAIRLGGGTYGGYFIMTGGKITNNTVRPAIDTGSEVNGSAGGVVFQQYGVFVMTGGEISNNTLDANGHAKSALAGGVLGNTQSNQRHANVPFYMTGGEIFGNKVIGTPAATVASAGGVLVSGAFQKTGGTIYGNDAGDESKRNKTELNTTGSKVSAIFVSGYASSNPATTGATKIRENTAGPDVTLFVTSSKSGTSAAGVNTVPAWATSFWD